MVRDLHISNTTSSALKTRGRVEIPHGKRWGLKVDSPMHHAFVKLCVILLGAHTGSNNGRRRKTPHGN